MPLIAWFALAAGALYLTVFKSRVNALTKTPTPAKAGSQNTGSSTSLASTGGLDSLVAGVAGLIGKVYTEASASTSGPTIGTGSPNTVEALGAGDGSPGNNFVETVSQSTNAGTGLAPPDGSDVGATVGTAEGADTTNFVDDLNAQLGL